MKGVLTEEELNEAIKNTDIVFRDRDKEKAVKALKLYLVDGYSSSQAMEQTGVHRTKITTGGKIILEEWRKIMAQKQ